MLSWRKTFRRFFHLPRVEEAAKQELAEAQLDLLEARTLKDYAEAEVQYHQARVARLEQFLLNRTTL